MDKAPYTKDFLHKEIQKFIRQYRDKPLMWMVNFTADVATALLVNNLMMIKPEYRQEALQKFIEVTQNNLAISEKKEEEPTLN